jgi:hypothetical protein
MRRKLFVVAVVVMGAFSMLASDVYAGRIAKFATAGRPKPGHRIKQRQCRKSLRSCQPHIIVIQPKQEKVNGGETQKSMEGEKTASK